MHFLFQAGARFLAWLSKGRSKTTRRSNDRTHIAAEVLESRILLSATTWQVSDGEFGDSTNWTDDVPGATDEAIIEGGLIAITLETNNTPTSFTVGSLTASGGFELDTMLQQLSITDDLELVQADTVSLTGGGTVSAGSINVDQSWLVVDDFTNLSAGSVVVHRTGDFDIWGMSRAEIDQKLDIRFNSTITLESESVLAVGIEPAGMTPEGIINGGDLFIREESVVTTTFLQLEGSGTVKVEGSSSSLIASQHIYVGTAGTGTARLDVLDGALAQSQSIGVGATLVTPGSVQIAGGAELVTDGFVSLSGATDRVAHIGVLKSSTVEVKEAASTWRIPNGGLLVGGWLTNASLTITDGGTVSANQITIGDIGNNLLPVQIVTVTGVDADGNRSTLEGGNLIFGSGASSVIRQPGSARGQPVISDGALVEIDGDARIGRSFPLGGPHEVTIDGQTTEFRLGGALRVGDEGSGRVNASNFATITSAGGTIGGAFNGPAEVNLRSGTDWNSSANVTVDNGGDLLLRNSELNFTDPNAALLELMGGRVRIESSLVRADSVITNTNDVWIILGENPGVITIGTFDADWDASAGVTLFAEIGGAAWNDVLHVTGDVYLGGILDVSLLGYTPVLDDTFDVVTVGGTISGEFDAVNLPTLDSGLTWDVIYGANVTLQVIEGDAPIAYDDWYDIDHDTTLDEFAPGVLDNDYDDDPLTAVLVGDVSNGSLTLNADGSFTYTPNTAFVGTDSFTYYATDGIANSAAVTATIDVTNDVPDAYEDWYYTDIDTTLNEPRPACWATTTTTTRSRRFSWPTSATAA